LAFVSKFLEKKDLFEILEENWSALGYPSKAHEEKYKKEGQKILEIGVEGDRIVDFQTGNMTQKEIMESYKE